MDFGAERLGSDEPPDLATYRANLALIREADVGIANLTPFRGPSADPGTVFELGFMAGLGKPVFGYSNAAGTLLDRVRAGSHAVRDDATATWRDGLDMEIEDFGRADNLMIDGCLREAGRLIVLPNTDSADLFRDLAGFERCLDKMLAEFVR